MGWSRWKDSLSSLCLATGWLLPRCLLEIWFPCSGSSCFSEYFCFAVYFASQCHLPSCLLLCPILPHMLIALLQPESQTVQESLSHDCHRLATDSFPLLLPGKHLLEAWHFFTPLLIYKPKYIHSAAPTGLILSKTHCSFNMPLQAIEIKTKFA